MWSRGKVGDGVVAIGTAASQTNTGSSYSRLRATSLPGGTVEAGTSAAVEVEPARRSSSCLVTADIV